MSGKGETDMRCAYQVGEDGGENTKTGAEVEVEVAGQQGELLHLRGEDGGEGCRVYEDKIVL